MTPQQIVDVLRAVETGGSLVFATAEEVDRFGGPVAVAQTRYAELKLEMPPAQASAVAQAGNGRHHAGSRHSRYPGGG